MVDSASPNTAIIITDSLSCRWKAEVWKNLRESLCSLSDFEALAYWLSIRCLCWNYSDFCAPKWLILRDLILVFFFWQQLCSGSPDQRGPSSDLYPIQFCCIIFIISRARTPIVDTHLELTRPINLTPNHSFHQ